MPTFRDLADYGAIFFNDGYRTKQSELGQPGFPILRVASVLDGRIALTETDIIHESLRPRIGTKLSEEGDFVLTTKGTVGRVARIGPDHINHVYSPQVCFFRILDQSVVDPDFFYYFLSSPQFRRQLGVFKSQTDMADYVNLRDLNAVQIELLNLATQRNAGRILRQIDDKVALNRRMNEILEAIGRAIFKSWFVDFDPVRAKSEGRDTGLPAHIAGLFPDSFDDSELGRIPHGWEVWTVNRVGDVICGKTPPTAVSEYYGNDVPFITIPDMHGNVFAWQTGRRLSRLGEESQPKKSLPPGSICVSCIATPGLVVITTEKSQTNQQINSVVPYEANQTYYWFWAFRDLGDAIKAGGSGGSVLSNLSTGRFSSLPIMAPSAILRSSYNTLVEPIFQKLLFNSEEASRLASLRDILLPKLISGEIRIKDAEKLVKMNV